MTIRFQKNEKQIRENLELLKKVFPADRLSTIEDYIDLFLTIFGSSYQEYFIEFRLLLMKRGIVYKYTNCDIKDFIEDRLRNGDYKKFKLKPKHEIDMMNGREFEVFLADFFCRCGYHVNLTPHSNDKGADLIIQTYGFGIRTVVQAKRCKKTIGVKAVQEVYAAQGCYKTDKSLVIISSKFSKPAKDMANKLNVELWDRQRLMQELNKYSFNL